MRHHLKFKNIRPTTVAAAEALFNARPWSVEDLNERVAIAQTFVDAVSQSYGTPTAQVTIARMFRDNVRYMPAVVEENALGEMHSISPPRIILDHWSIMSLFYGTRVHLIAHGEAPISETDPFSWAASLFYTVRPEMFRARVREGRIVGMAARDTYSSETWGRLVAAGVADEENGTLRVARDVVARVLNGESTESTSSVAVADDEVSEDAVSELVEGAEEFLNGHTEDSVSEAPEATGDPLAGINRDTLRTMAKDRNIAGRGRMSADELREAIRQHDADQHED